MVDGNEGCGFVFISVGFVHQSCGCFKLDLFGSFCSCDFNTILSSDITILTIFANPIHLLQTARKRSLLHRPKLHAQALPHHRIRCQMSHPCQTQRRGHRRPQRRSRHPLRPTWMCTHYPSIRLFRGTRQLLPSHGNNVWGGIV